MAGFMAVPMALLMRHRGHGWGRTAEMVGAMVVPVAAACLLWRFGLGAAVPAVAAPALGTSSHVAMYVGMLLAMLYRFEDYAHAGHHGGTGPAAPPPHARAGAADMAGRVTFAMAPRRPGPRSPWRRAPARG
jgi:hypothetical protein